MKTQIDTHTLKVLEFEKITTLLSKFATSEIGKLSCNNITPRTDYSWIKKKLKEVTEMKSFINIHGLLPFNGLKNITQILEKAKPATSALSPLELWDILTLVESSQSVKDLLKREKDKYPVIGGLANKIEVLIPLKKKLSAAVDSEGEILDSASKKLERIRIEVKNIRKKIKSVLETIINHRDYTACIQGKFITLRHNRYVIPLKADLKARIPGIVHDQSKNRATCFVEPFNVVELNNGLTLLKDEEKREEIQVLRHLTALVVEKEEALIKNQQCLGALDSIQARARMSEKMGAKEPELLSQGDVHLLQARHPILFHQPPFPEEKNPLPLFESSKVVPIDLIFPSEYSALIITGANMGGKTAALKSFGLLTLMVQAGMHIPVAEGSRLPVWGSIFADIGDEQNLEESISTFSSHINQLNKILNEANETSLVLLDEVGTGTDPHEGAALVLAIIDALRTRKAKVAVTSHLNLLKAYAASLPDVMNVSVKFDSATLEPTFKLLYGVPGNSKAFETAARLGIDAQILAKARVYLKEYNWRILELIEDLESTIQSMLGIKNTLAKVLLLASRYEELITTLAKKIDRKKEAVFSQIEAKARVLFREAEAELKKIKKSSSSLGKERNKKIQCDLSSVKKKFGKSLIRTKIPNKKLGVLKKGTLLILGKEGKEGKIVNIDDLSTKVEILVGDVRLKADINELTKIEGVRMGPDQRPKSETSGIKLLSPEPSEPLLPLNLIGLTVDEAIPIVDKAIDKALLCNKKDLRIIHGLGTGRLRQAIHNYLKQQPRIKHFYLGTPLEGGAGITIVEL